jgi:hypothetical protein
MAEQRRKKQLLLGVAGYILWDKQRMILGGGWEKITWNRVWGGVEK